MSIISPPESRQLPYHLSRGHHACGALYKVLARIYALGINVTKLESRPIPDRDFEFMFYFDLETSIYSQEFQELMGELEDFCEEFKYLGSFSEVV